MLNSLKRLKIPDVGEIIHRNFVNFFRVMPKDSAIYGGVLRDIAAGMEMAGDIDVMVSASVYKEVVDTIAKSPWWARAHDYEMPKPKIILAHSKEGNHLQEQMKRLHPNWNTFVTSAKSEFFGKDQVVENTGPPAVFDFGKAYDKFPGIGNVSSLRNEENKVLQIVSTKHMAQQDLLSSVLFSIREVDIVCCGLAMLSNGRIYEIVPDAYEHCQKRILKENRLCSVFDIPTLKRREARLINRGWKSLIDWEYVSKHTTIKKEKINTKPRENKIYLTYDKEKKAYRLVVSSRVNFIKQIEAIGNLKTHLNMDYTYEIIMYHKDDKNRRNGNRRYALLCKLTDKHLQKDISKILQKQFIDRCKYVCEALHYKFVDKINNPHEIKKGKENEVEACVISVPEGQRLFTIDNNVDLPEIDVCVAKKDMAINYGGSKLRRDRTPDHTCCEPSTAHKLAIPSPSKSSTKPTNRCVKEPPITENFVDYIKQARIYNEYGRREPIRIPQKIDGDAKLFSWAEPAFDEDIEELTPNEEATEKKAAKILSGEPTKKEKFTDTFASILENKYIEKYMELSKKRERGNYFDMELRKWDTKPGDC